LLSLQRSLDKGREPLIIINPTEAIYNAGAKESADSSRLLHKVVEDSRVVSISDEDISNAAVHFLECNLALALDRENGVKTSLNRFYDAKLHNPLKRRAESSPKTRSTRPRAKDTNHDEDFMSILNTYAENTERALRSISSQIKDMSQNLTQTNERMFTMENALKADYTLLSEKVEAISQKAEAISQKANVHSEKVDEVQRLIKTIHLSDCN